MVCDRAQSVGKKDITKPEKVIYMGLILRQGSYILSLISQVPMGLHTHNIHSMQEIWIHIFAISHTFRVASALAITTERATSQCKFKMFCFSCLWQITGRKSMQWLYFAVSIVVRAQEHPKECQTFHLRSGKSERKTPQGYIEKDCSYMDRPLIWATISYQDRKQEDIYIADGGVGN